MHQINHCFIHEEVNIFYVQVLHIFIHQESGDELLIRSTIKERSLGTGHVKTQTADCADCCRPCRLRRPRRLCRLGIFFKINLLFFTFFYLANWFAEGVFTYTFLLFAIPIDTWKPGMVLEKKI